MSLSVTRERRANAGNRYQNQREDIEMEVGDEYGDTFKELSDDEEFMESNDDEDTVDSDFNTEEDDDDYDDDNGEAEKLILIEEKREEKEKKKKARRALILPPLSINLRKRKTDQLSNEDICNNSVKHFSSQKKDLTQSKRRNPKSINNNNLEDDKQQLAPILPRVRSSSRSYTLQSKQLLAEKLKEYEEKKLLYPKREKIVSEILTQEELLAEAKETEARNLASLKEFELRENKIKNTVRRSNRVSLENQPRVIEYSFIKEINHNDDDDDDDNGDDGDGDDSLQKLSSSPKLIIEVSNNNNNNNNNKELINSSSVLDNNIVILDDDDDDNKNNSSSSGDTIDNKQPIQDNRIFKKVVIFKNLSHAQEFELFRDWRKKTQSIFFF